MKRPLVLAAECVVTILISLVVGWVANRFSHKENRQAQALERIAAVLERPSEERRLASNIRIIEAPAPGPNPDPCDEVRFTARRK